jgi:hypothetical protein
LAIGSNASGLFDKSIKYSSSSFETAEIKAGQSFIYSENGLNYMACPVKSIEKIVYEKPVYDLTVDRDESYIADGVAVHNCSVEYSVCNICSNKAERTEDYCIHIKNRKGRSFTGTAKDVKTGEVKKFKNHPVYEYNYGIKFIELSAVVDPACPSCHIDYIVKDNDEYIKKVANLQNSLYMIRTAALQKQASQEDLDQLNGCLETLEGIAVGLIQNRQQVEVEFASDLVAILSDLQGFVDELTGAGYGQVPGSQNAPEDIGGPEMGGEMAPEGMEGMEGMEGAEAPAMQGDMGMGEMPPAPAAQPVGATESIQPTEVGSVSGGQGASPAMPSAPTMPILSFNTNKLQKVASFMPELSKIKDQFSNEEDDDMAKRRTLAAKKTQKDDVIEKLSNSWKEKQEFIEYINKLPSTENNGVKLSVKRTDENFVIIAEVGEANKAWTYEDLSEEDKKVIKEDPKGASLHFIEAFTNMNNIKGDNKMTNKREAGADSVNKDPEVITEVQLQEQRDLYHAREEDDREVITEKLLDEDTGSHKRSGEQEVLTEVQLDDKRTGVEAEVITEAQLDSKGDEKEVVTQKQLDDYRAGEQEVLTEAQLNDVDTPWSRAASRDASQFKSASEHLGLVVEALADTTLQTGCTPAEVCKVASSLVASTKARFDFGNAILSDSEVAEDVDYASRVAFWSTKNVKVAGVGSDVVSSALIGKLQAVASDVTVDPETVITAIDVTTEDQAGVDRITERVEEKISEASQVAEETVSARDEMREALKSQSSKDLEAREEERQEILASLEEEVVEASSEEALEETKEWSEEMGNADTIIEATFDEVGLEVEAERDESFRTAIASFTKGAMASRQQKVAAITNVTISGDTISIAVQTDAGEQSVEIPVGEEVAPAEEALPAEGDLSGEALEAGMPSYASENGKMQKEAQQFMGGGVGGDAGAPAGGNADPSASLDAPIPETEGIQAFTEDEAVETDIPTAGEQQLPYAICPECGSNDVDIDRDNEGGIKGSCQSCGAEYEALIKKEVEFKIIKPTKSVGEEGAALAEAPEVPAVPVAASTRIGKDSIVRIAQNTEKHGEVCPACGMGGHEAVKAENGAKEFTCTACDTHVSKEIVVSSTDPEDAHLVVSWDYKMEPKGCDECEEAKKAFASKLKIEQLMKSASDADFPMANCKELVAKKYGGNAVATYGPCKGEVLADCVCKDLSKFALRNVRHMEKLADVYTQEDPMDECLADQQKHGKTVKEASEICNCLKDKYDESGNVFEQAFGEDVESGTEKMLTASDLQVMADFIVEEVIEEPAEDVDMADAFPKEEETVSVELPVEVAEEVAMAVEEAIVPVEEVEEIEEVAEEVEETAVEPDMDSASELEVAAESVGGELSEEDGKELAMAMQSHKLRRVGEEVVKIAGKPEVVKDIEGDVEAGVPRKDETLGHEGADNINVPMADPSIPRGDATMGHEGAENVNPEAGLPDVAVDSSYMGDEKSAQEGMPAINNELKGTVIAEEADKVTKEAGLEVVETVEGEVEAGVPRGDATLGHEGKDNVDVDAGKPDIPTGDATMGNEGKDNIDVDAGLPDVPVKGDATMGHEDETLKGTPEVSNKYLKQVEQNSKKELQLERLATARKIEAIKVASKLVATDRIVEAAYDNAVEALSQFKIDQIASVADNMFPAKQQKIASVEETGHSIPAIVQESKDTIKTASTEETLQDKLSKHLTIGNREFDDKLKEWGEK